MLTTGTEVGGYRIEGILGRGGMGVVYEAMQLSLGRTVALKLLAAELTHDADFRERFRREARTQAIIEHAHIVPVFEAGELPEGLYIAMRLVRGPNLKQLIAGGELEPARAVAILLPVGDALDTAHEADLIHRDIKPQNILVGRRDHAFLADFGLTKGKSDTGYTRTGQLMGTVDYVAPEQIKGELATGASDIYALAAVAYECLVGRPPFTRPTELATLYAHVSDPPPLASIEHPGLPAAVDEVLAAGLAKNPADRPPTALELITALEAALRSTPRPAPSPAESGDVTKPLPLRQAPTMPQPPPEAGPGQPTEIVAPVGVPTRDDIRRDWSPDAADAAAQADEARQRERREQEARGDEERERRRAERERMREQAEAQEREVAEARDRDEAQAQKREVAEREAAEAKAREREVAERETAGARAREREVAEREAAEARGREREVAEREAAAATERARKAADVKEREAAEVKARERKAAEAEERDRERKRKAAAAAAAKEADRARKAAAKERKAAAKAEPREPAPTAAAPRRATGRTWWIAGAVAVALAAVVGVVAGGAGKEAPEPPPERPALTAGSIGFQGPAGWRETADAGLAAPQFEGETAAVAAGEGTIVAGMTAGDGPTLLPADLRELLPEDPEGTPVRLGDLQAYRYDGLQPDGVDGELTLYVAPTSEGIVTLACHQASDEACGAAAATLTADGATPVALGPQTAYATAVDRTLEQLGRRRASAAKRLDAAEGPKGQARAAAAIADAYADARKQLAAAPATALEAEAHPRLVRAVRDAGREWNALAGDARKYRRKAYAEQRQAVRGSERQVGAAVAALGALGYDLR